MGGVNSIKQENILSLFVLFVLCNQHSDGNVEAAGNSGAGEAPERRMLLAAAPPYRMGPGLGAYASGLMKRGGG